MTDFSVLLLMAMLGVSSVFGRECVLDSDCEQSQQFGRIQAIQVSSVSTSDKMYVRFVFSTKVLKK